MTGHRNSFDVLRLLFALLVIITHSVALSGHGETDFLLRLTGGAISCSYLGVRGFFIISGFLVFISLQRSAGPAGYLKKRLLRIFPAFLVMLAVVVFLLGPFLSSYGPAEYLRQPGIWHYAGSALRLPGVPRTAVLPGAFTHNPAGPAVNGSLWTIWFELLFYCFLLLLFPLRRSAVLRMLLPGLWLGLYAALIFGHRFLDSHIFPFTGMSAEVAVDLGLYFLGGCVLTLVPWGSVRLRYWALGGLALLLIGLGTHSFYYLRYIGLPVLVLAAGHAYRPALAGIRRAGEPSYGIYIYAYPMQQALVQVFAPSPLVLTLATMTLATAMGLLSWHLVERPALRLKRSVPGAPEKKVAV